MNLDAITLQQQEQEYKLSLRSNRFAAKKRMATFIQSQMNKKYFDRLDYRNLSWLHTEQYNRLENQEYRQKCDILTQALIPYADVAMSLQDVYHHQHFINACMLCMYYQGTPLRKTVQNRCGVFIRRCAPEDDDLEPRKTELYETLARALIEAMDEGEEHLAEKAEKADVHEVIKLLQELQRGIDQIKEALCQKPKEKPSSKKKTRSKKSSPELGMEIQLQLP